MNRLREHWWRPVDSKVSRRPDDFVRGNIDIPDQFHRCRLAVANAGSFEQTIVNSARCSQTRHYPFDFHGSPSPQQRMPELRIQAQVGPIYQLHGAACTTTRSVIDKWEKCEVSGVSPASFRRLCSLAGCELWSEEGAQCGMG